MVQGLRRCLYAQADLATGPKPTTLDRQRRIWVDCERGAVELKKAIVASWREGCGHG